jgi:hypothetical protein
MSSNSLADRLPKSVHIHWSTRATLRSPDGKWTLYVKPSNQDDGAAKVYISDTHNKSRLQLFKLQRDAEVYWRADQSRLVILDEASSDTYRFLVFDPKRPLEPTALILNSKIAQDARAHLGAADQIIYYFPRISRWLGPSEAVIAVGIVTAHHGASPFTVHCLGYIANIESQKIKLKLNQKELEREYGSSCQVWP